jgi:DNA-binding NarL/FixJ family response regulator
MRPTGDKQVRTVLLADDHAVARSSVRSDLEELGFEICGEAGDAEGAVLEAIRSHPDICLLDVGMPGSGIAAARAIRDRVPETRVVMLTVSRDPADVSAAVDAGAVGYVLKDLETERLAELLADVLEGRTVLPPLH